jgi:2-pyrone-4,6-dicarboxylate lactonase
MQRTDIERSDSMQLPLGTIDTHFHLFGPESLYPYASHRGYTPVDVSLGDYLDVARGLGISRAVIVQPSPYGTDNRRLLDGMAESPIEMRGVVAVDADISDKDLADMHQVGVRGVRINLVFDKMAAVQTAISLAPRLRELGWHVQFLADVSAWPDVAAFVRQLDIPVVFDHLGHVPAHLGLRNQGFQAFLALLREGRVWAKASGMYRMAAPGAKSPYEHVCPFFMAAVAANPGRIVWATDWPHTSIHVPMPKDRALAEMVLNWIGPNHEIRQAIFVDNANTLYGFKEC